MLAQVADAHFHALANSAELPLAIVFVELAEYGSGVSIEIFFQIVAGNLGAFVVQVDDANERVVDLAKVLLALAGLIDHDANQDLRNIGRDFAELNVNFLVIA